MFRSLLLSCPSTLFCVLAILIAVQNAALESGSHENGSQNEENKPKLSLFMNDSTLVYEFSNSSSINQVLLVRDRALLVAGTNFVYLLKDQIYLKANDSKDSPVFWPIKSVGFLGKEPFLGKNPNAANPPVNEIKILTAIDEDKFLVCGTLNQGKCYLLYANIRDFAGSDPSPPNSSYELKLVDKLRDNAYNHLGYSEVRCERQGFFQHPLNCSRFYSCLPMGFGLKRKELDCPYVKLGNEWTSLVFNEKQVHCDLPRNTKCKSDQPDYENFEYLRRSSRMLLPVRISQEDPKKEEKGKKDDLLFVLANEPDDDDENGRGRNRDRPMHLPYLSKLQFNKKETKLELRESGRFASSIDLSRNHRRFGVYQMELVYLYAVGSYAFILKREKESWQPTKTRLGKLVIDSDEQQYSHGYVELPLTCKDPENGETFTYAGSAHFGFGDSSIPGSGASSPESTKGDTLFVTFNSFNDTAGEVDQAKGSLLCAFPEEKLRSEFGKALENCRQGSSRNVRLMTRYSALTDSTRCPKRERRDTSSAHDDYVESLEDVEGYFVYKLKNQVITSLASTVHDQSPNGKNNLFALGTQQGELLLLVRQNGTLKSEIKFSSNDPVIGSKESSPIHGNPLVDKNDHAYFTAAHRLVRISLSEKECRGRKLEWKEIEAMGDAMGRCKEAFRRKSATEKAQMWNEIGTANVSCFLSTNHANYEATCKKCIEEMIEETWTCGYSQEARVWNRMCSVEYQCLGIYDPTRSTHQPDPTDPTDPTESPTREDDIPSSLESSSLAKMLVVALLAIFVVLVALCCVIVVRRFWSRKAKQAREARDEEIERRTIEQIKRQQIEQNRKLQNQAIPITPNAPPAEAFDTQLSDFKGVVLDRSWLQIERPIGNGNYGCVYKGTLRKPGELIRMVAVKKLRRGASFTVDGARRELLNEAKTMQQLRHENILEMLGVCFDGEVPMLVLPFMQNGDLLAYIRSEDNSPTVRDLLHFAIDIGNGMAYLSSLKYIHRDLAARNCMLDENLRIKVGDFGLTRDVYERNYYVASEQREMPIRWMSVEAIERNKVTTMSDIWSYGVLLWELMTRGNIPYPGMEVADVYAFVKRGGRMAKPEICLDAIYEIMLDCWRVDPNRRPSFDRIVQRIEAVTKQEDTKTTYVFLNVNYVDYPIDEYYAREDARWAKRAAEEEAGRVYANFKR